MAEAGRSSLESAAPSTASLPVSLPPSPPDLSTTLRIFSPQVLRTEDTG